MKIDIIHSDSDILVINKPSGVSVTKDRSGDADIMAVLIKQDASLNGKLRLIHRLDKLTSGVMVLAKNKAAQSRFSSLFEKRQARKLYLALVSGFLSEKNGTIDTPIARNKKDITKMRIDRRHGKDAITDWKLLADFGTMALLAAIPKTGRTHQIRVHLASIGLPLAIDPLYSSSRPVMLSDFKMNYRLAKGKKEKPLIDRLTLHSYQLELPGYDELFIAKVDKKFAATIKMLNKYASAQDNADDDIAELIGKTLR